MISAEDIIAMTDIAVYSMPNCEPCKATKKWLARNGIPFEERDVSSSSDAHLAALQRLGYRSVPVVVAGTQHWQGFDPSRLRSLADDLA